LILVGGFSALAGEKRADVARLNTGESGSQVLTYEGSTVQWLRAGTIAEIWRGTVEYSTNGTRWIALGDLGYGPDGWQLTKVASPVGATLRARGFVGDGGHSGWFVEGYCGRPLTLAQPQSQTREAGDGAVLRVRVGGSEPMACQWFKDEAPLQDGDAVLGATSATLQLTQLAGADAGAYLVVISNRFGVSTSASAVVSVRDPAITLHPSSQRRDPGESFTVPVTTRMGCGGPLNLKAAPSFRPGP
jgi:hypothetical protein